MFLQNGWVCRRELLLLASLNVSKREYMYYTKCIQLSRQKKSKSKKKYCEKPDIILIRHSDTLLFISLFNKTVHLCISLPSQTRYFSRVDPYLWHYKKIKNKRIHLTCRKKKKKSLFSYLNSNEKKFKARCWTQKSNGWPGMIFVQLWCLLAFTSSISNHQED